MAWVAEPCWRPEPRIPAPHMEEQGHPSQITPMSWVTSGFGPPPLHLLGALRAWDLPSIWPVSPFFPTSVLTPLLS